MHNKKIKIKNKKKLRAIKATTKNKRVHNRAMVLLMIGKGKSQADVVKLEILSLSGIKNILNRYLIGGVDFAVFDSPRSGRPSIYSNSDKQRIAAKACAEPPTGYARWTVALLTNEVENDVKILSASRETVRMALHESNRLRKLGISSMNFVSVKLGEFHIKCLC